MKKILALDPATETGWCLSVLENKYGTWSFKLKKHQSSGMKWMMFEKQLSDFIDEHKIEIVAFERPGGRHKGALMHHASLVSCIEKVCEIHEIECCGFSASQIKKHATGKGNCNKEKMIQVAQEEFGYKGNNDNVADAIHLWNLACITLLPNATL